MTPILYEIADELRAVADYGLMYVQNDYDRDRYEKVQKLSAKLLGMLESKPETEILQLFQPLKNRFDDVHHPSPYMPAREP